MPLKLPDNDYDRERVAAGVEKELGLSDEVSGLVYGALLRAEGKSLGGLTIRRPAPKDLGALISLQKLARHHDPELVLAPELIEQMLAHHSDLMMVMEEGRTGALVGDLMLAPVQFASELAHQKARWHPFLKQIQSNAGQSLPEAPPEYFPAGWALEGLDASVHPKYQVSEIGISLHLALALDLAIHFPSKPPRCLTWARTPQYSKWVVSQGGKGKTYRDFLGSLAGRYEPTLKLARDIGARKVGTGLYWPKDIKSGGMAVRVDQTPVIQAFIDASQLL